MLLLKILERKITWPIYFDRLPDDGFDCMNHQAFDTIIVPLTTMGVQNEPDTCDIWSVHWIAELLSLLSFFTNPIDLEKHPSKRETKVKVNNRAWSKGFTLRCAQHRIWRVWWSAKPQMSQAAATRHCWQGQSAKKSSADVCYLQPSHQKMSKSWKNLRIIHPFPRKKTQEIPFKQNKLEIALNFVGEVG